MSTCPKDAPFTCEMLDLGPVRKSPLVTEEGNEMVCNDIANVGSYTILCEIPFSSRFLFLLLEIRERVAVRDV